MGYTVFSCSCAKYGIIFMMVILRARRLNSLTFAQILAIHSGFPAKNMNTVKIGQQHLPLDELGNISMAKLLCLRMRRVKYRPSRSQQNH